MEVSPSSKEINFIPLVGHEFGVKVSVACTICAGTGASLFTSFLFVIARA